MKLYKYRIFNAYSLASLVSKEIWASKPGNFNDPFDCPATWLSVNVSEKIAKNKEGEVRDARERMGQFRRAAAHGFITQDDLEWYESIENISKKVAEARKVRDARERMGQFRRAAAHGHIPWGDLEWYETTNTEYRAVTYTKNLSDEQLKAIDNMGIYSLSETAEDILMWSHYADEHKGFCIEYDAIGESTGAVELVTVDYDAINPPKISNYVSIDQLRRQVSGMKANQWKYEKEHRLIFKEGNKAYPEPYPISSIIFGLRMPDSHREAIRRILSDRSEIRFKKVARGSQIFQLRVEELM